MDQYIAIRFFKARDYPKANIFLGIYILGKTRNSWFPPNRQTFAICSDSYYPSLWFDTCPTSDFMNNTY